MPRHRSCIPTAFMSWLSICLIHSGKAQFSKKQIWWDLVILYLIRTKVTMVSQVLISWGFLFISFVHEIEISIRCSVQWFITRFTKLKAYISMYSVPCTIPTTTTTHHHCHHRHRCYYQTPTLIVFILLALYQ